MDFFIPSGSELVGLWSEHHNYREDRVWKAKTCQLSCGLEKAHFTIIKVDWDVTGISRLMKPTIVDTKSLRNPTGATVEGTVSFKQTRSTSETTRWENSFGVQTEFHAGVNIGIVDLSTTVTISYDSTHGQENTVNEETEVTQEYKITVPPETNVIAKLVVKKSPNLTIPFVATLRKVQNGVVSTVKERGTWRGVLYYDTSIALESSYSLLKSVGYKDFSES